MVRCLIVATIAWALSALPLLSHGLTADDVQCTGCVGKKDLARKSVTGKKLRKNSVTSKKIKNHSIRKKDLAASVLAGPKNVVQVAKSGGDFTNPVAAVNSITDASPGIRYLVKIAPGVYDLGAATLQMKPYVDVVGAGAETTVLRGTVEGDPTHTNMFEHGVVTGANNAALSNLSVEHTGGGVDSAVAIFNPSTSTSFAMHHLAAKTTGAATDSAAAVRDGGAATISHVHATVDSTAPAIVGLVVAGAGNLANAVVSTSGSGAFNFGVVVGPGCQANGIVSATTGGDTSVAVTGVGARMRDIDARAEGATTTAGILMIGGSLFGAVADAQGGSGANTGISITNGAIIFSARATASDAVNIGLAINNNADRVTNTVVSSRNDMAIAAVNCRDVYDEALVGLPC